MPLCEGRLSLSPTSHSLCWDEMVSATMPTPTPAGQKCSALETTQCALFGGMGKQSE